MIPRIAHFVFGLDEQHEPLHFLRYASIESCRRLLEPDAIYFHHKHLPWGHWWEQISPYLTLVEANESAEVSALDYSAGHVPAQYRYAHHADFVRLDALIEHGGVYADIDTIFVRPIPDELFAAPFVVGAEPDVLDERARRLRPSLCNALLMAEPGAAFARAWRARIGDALDGTWSNHSGFLPQLISLEMPEAVRVMPQHSFYPFGPDQRSVSDLLEQDHAVPEETLSVHLWAHLWWERDRRDISTVHAGWYTRSFIREGKTTLAQITQAYLPDRSRPTKLPARNRWSYLSLDERSGYGIAADRCMAALERSGITIEWTPFVGGRRWGLGYEPVASRISSIADAEIVVAHLTAEFLPAVRELNEHATLVAHTVWDTDRLADHWIPCLDAANLIVVPSRFSAEAITASASTTPVVVVPHVAPEIDRRSATGWSRIPADVVVFYTIGEWNERKAVFKTIEAYLSAFTAADPVLLVVKTSHADRRLGHSNVRRMAGQGTSAWWLAQRLAQHPNPPAVQLVTRALTPAEIAGLHRRGDCYVSLCRSEGWGLGAFDAAAHGNPVVITGFGGQLDFLAGSPYLIDFELVSVQDPAGFPSYAPDQRWAEPRVEHGAALMREVATDLDQARAAFGKLASAIAERFEPGVVAAAFRAAVEEHRRHTPAPAAATRP